ncbi:hypothetical protein F2Q70_00003588 [Brassica cretica]|uniref:Uncharacterized protein n=1 Tax=Brassica cretica TaxID=69181 RepID=A0A8S9IJE1_BRACR|nr:hypothetical protein F2Q70_00003588 [Brassica cretica]
MYLPGFSPVWCIVEIPSMDPSLGDKTIKQVLELPIERRQVPFLVSKEALERCSIWGNMSGSKGEEAFAEYKRALEVMSAKKAAPKKAAPSENDDEVQFIKGNKRQAATSQASSSKKKSRASGSTPRVSPTSLNDLATVLANLNTKVFPLTPVILPEGDSFASIQLNQGNVSAVPSGERMDEHASLKVDLAELTSQLREDKKNVLAKEKEIKALKLKVRNQDEAGALAAAENVSLREQFSLYISRMKSKPDLALEFSSIGGRIRSKKERSSVGSSESMDFSGSLLDLTAEVENLSRKVVDLGPSSAEVCEFPPVGPLSSIGVNEVANWRAKYHLSDDVVIRIPGPIDRVSDFEVDEVPVYEVFFESGFRDQVPSLVAKVSEALEISPGQLNPPSWRNLTALQNLGDLEGLTVGVAEVLHSELPVQEITKKNRKRVPAFDGRWTEKFAFMYLPGFSPVWCTAKIPCMDPSLGEKTIKQVLELPIERRQVPFLVSKEALELCSIWGNMSGSKGEEAFAKYKRALEVMSAKKAAPKKAAPSENDDEVQFIKSNKRQAATSLASSSKKKSRASGSTPRVSPTSSNDPATVLANLNTKVFPLTPVILPEGDSFASIQLNQGNVSAVPSGERMDEHASLKVDLAELTSQLREDKKNVLAKEKEIKALKLKKVSIDIPMGVSIDTPFAPSIDYSSVISIDAL